MPETGKDRSSQIELDYYRHRGGLARWKVRLALLGLILGCCVLVYALYDGRAANPGLLAEGHAAFEQDCDQCHQSLTPIGNDSVRALPLLGITESASVEHTLNACTSCHASTEHPIAGHHRAQMNAEGQLADKNCATCHAEHQGRDHDLTLVASEKCTNCHSELATVCASCEMVRDRNIESFVDKHGDFASLDREDPGRITFDHAQHLLAGQPSKGKDVVRLRDLEPEQRDRYRSRMQALQQREPEFASLDTSDDALVQLDCGSCHELSGAAALGQGAGQELAAHFNPISFDTHCAACHSMNPAGRGENMLAIPHAAPWTEIEQWLEAKQTRQAIVPSRANPTGIGKTKSSTSVNAEVAANWKSAKLAQSREMVRQQCLKCHESSLIESDASIMAARNRDAPSLIPNRWLVHGSYDHGAHASVSCRYCHDEVYAEGMPSQPGRDQDIVMISGIETCNGCHRPAGDPTPASLLVASKPNPLLGRQPLWASDRCVTCHRYHVDSSFVEASSSVAMAVVGAAFDDVDRSDAGGGE